MLVFKCESFVITILYTVLGFNLIQVVASKSCYNAYSCAYQNISVNDGTTLQCWGFASCSNSKSITTSNGSYLSCAGSYACYNTEKIRVNSDYIYPYAVACDSLFSCANITRFFIQDPVLHCYGELSCAYSNITQASPTQGVQCFGGRSCVGAKISIPSSTGGFQIKGHLAGYNAILQASKFYFYGRDSGLNSTIICKKGQTCTVACYSNACHNMVLICETEGNGNGTNNSCQFNINCKHSEKTDVCPYGFDLELYKDFASIPDWNSITTTLKAQVTTFDNSFVVCESSIINCSNLDSCNNIELMTDDDPICCNGARSCVADSIITSKNSLIRCDGSISCRNNLQYTSTENGGDIYFTATNFKSTGYVYTNYTITTNGKGDIFCSGESHCLRSKLVNGKNVYCTSEYGCANATIESFDNVFAYALSAALTSNITDIEQNVYCATMQSCKGATIANVESAVYASGNQALYESNIINATTVCTKTDTYKYMVGLIYNLTCVLYKVARIIKYTLTYV